MSRRPIARSPHLSQLLAEGYDIAIRANHLVVRGIPYVTAGKQIREGVLITRLSLVDDRAGTPDDHTIFFSGEYPCDQNGREISGIRCMTQLWTFGSDLTADHQFSAKPVSGNYANYYDKITTYAALLSGPAQMLDPSVKPNKGSFVAADDADDEIFRYLDTASPRAEIMEATAKLECRKIIVIGLGGTGGYVLDLLAKTPVAEIHLFDGDTFQQHNAFRAPGAASGADLEAEPFKVDYFASIYSRMRRGIVPRPVYVDEKNIDELKDADFVFLCIDDGLAKKMIVRSLEGFGIPFIDVGMGLFMQGGSLGGTVRTTTSTPQKRAHIWDEKRISFAAPDGDNDYNRNIQVADLNALNAVLAVIKWKKLCGFYIDLEREHHSTYTIDGDDIINEDVA
ncbi:MAG: hypothetical protein DI540_10150 [Sphingobium sp.]|nr:MAG: hypothetical protein DI540_10150 [Sphingobium sp.]